MATCYLPPRRFIIAWDWTGMWRELSWPLSSILYMCTTCWTELLVAASVVMDKVVTSSAFEVSLKSLLQCVEDGVTTPVTDFRLVWVAEVCKCWQVLGSKIDAVIAFHPSPGYAPAVSAAVVCVMWSIYHKLQSHLHLLNIIYSIYKTSTNEMGMTRLM